MASLRSVVEGVLRGETPEGAVRRVEGPDPALVLVPDRLEAWFEGQPMSLKPRAFRLLLVATTAGDLSREELVRQVWQEPYRKGSSDNRLRVALSRLRKNLPAALALEKTPRGGLRLARASAVWVVKPARRIVASPRRALQGREDLLAGLQSQSLLLGPPGSGKTAVARAWLDRPEDRAVYVLVPADEDGLNCALADALGVRMSTRGQLVAACRGVRLVLDGAEAAPEAVTRLVEELDCSVLVCSRVPVDGPLTRVRLPPLSQRDAVRLLEAAMARRGRPPLPRERPNLERLVDRLDRLPLALELAAARAGVLSPSAMLERLGRGQDLLRDGETSLRAVLEQSWQALDPSVQELLGRLAALPSFTLDTAEAVGGLDALDLVQQAHDHGLLEVEGDRFRLLHTVRDLVQKKRDPAVAEHLLTRCAHAQSRLDGDQAGEAMRTLVDERDTLLALHRWGGEVRARAGFSLLSLIILRGNIPRPLQLLQQSLDQTRDPDRRARLHVARAQLLTLAGKADAAIAELEGLEHRSCPRARGMAWTALGAFEQAQLAFDGASWWDDLSEARLREARAVLNLRRGLLDAAEQDLRRAGALFGRHGNRRGEARTLANMSDLQSQHGQFAAAEDSARRGAEAARASGDNVVLTYCLANQGVALQGLGQDASQALTRAHALATRLGNLPLARSLHELMHPAGDPDYSAR